MFLQLLNEINCFLLKSQLTKHEKITQSTKKITRTTKNIKRLTWDESSYQSFMLKSAQAVNELVNPRQN